MMRLGHTGQAASCLAGAQGALCTARPSRFTPLAAVAGLMLLLLPGA